MTRPSLITEAYRNWRQRQNEASTINMWGETARQHQLLNSRPLMDRLLILNYYSCWLEFNNRYNASPLIFQQDGFLSTYYIGIGWECFLLLYYVFKWVPCQKNNLKGHQLNLLKTQTLGKEIKNPNYKNNHAQKNMANAFFRGRGTNELWVFQQITKKKSNKKKNKR